MGEVQVLTEHIYKPTASYRGGKREHSSVGRAVTKSFLMCAINIDTTDVGSNPTVLTINRSEYADRNLKDKL